MDDQARKKSNLRDPSGSLEREEKRPKTQIEGVEREAHAIEESALEKVKTEKATAEKHVAHVKEIFSSNAPEAEVDKEYREYIARMTTEEYTAFRKEFFRKLDEESLAIGVAEGYISPGEPEPEPETKTYDEWILEERNMVKDFIINYIQNQQRD